MRIFVFEFTTGGGLLPARRALDPAGTGWPRRLDSSLLREGAAMVAALASDFAALSDCEVHILQDCDVDLTLPASVRVHVVQMEAEYRAAFDEHSAAAAWTVVLAPECDGALLDLAKRALTCGGRLLSPGPQLVRLASDKHATAEHLARAGVPVPRGALLPPRDPIPTYLRWPVVIKPSDGAGSQGVRLLHSMADYTAAIRALGGSFAQNTRVEEYCPGEASSVAFLCGPCACVALPPCRQRLGQDGRFAYLGGSTPLEEGLAARAVAIASRAVATLEGAAGYLGVDLVLGADPAGRDDRVIEINPRLTTSYVGLRAALDANLAAAMLDVAEGRGPTFVTTPRPVEFTAAGRINAAAKWLDA